MDKLKGRQIVRGLMDWAYRAGKNGIPLNYYEQGRDESTAWIKEVKK